MAMAMAMTMMKMILTRCPPSMIRQELGVFHSSLTQLPSKLCSCLKKSPAGILLVIMIIIIMNMVIMIIIMICSCLKESPAVYDYEYSQKKKTLLFFHSPDCNGAALRVHRFHTTFWHLGHRVMKYLDYYQEFFCLIDFNLHNHNHNTLCFLSLVWLVLTSSA